jgi:hypothetical protein
LGAVVINYKRSRKLQTHHKNCCSGVYASAEPENFAIFEVVREVDIIQHLRRAWRDRGFSLLELLRYLDSRLATDPRDKIYALLSLATIWDETKVAPLVADYSASDSTVYQRAVVSTILSTGSTNVLTLNSGEGFSRDFPSWVPDWSTPPSRVTYLDSGVRQQRLASLSLYKAWSGPWQDPVWKDPFLAIAGCYVDVVKIVGEPMISNNKDLQLRVMATFDQWRDIAQLSDQSDTKYTSGECTMHEAFWRTTLGDVMFESLPSLGSVSAMPFERFRRTVPEDEQTWKKYVEWTKNLLSDISREGYPHEWPRNQALMENNPGNSYFGSRCMNRTFFITERGYMGIGPLQTQHGDVVYLLGGSTVPFVLRKDIDHHLPTSQSVDPRAEIDNRVPTMGEQHYRLVGDCFVHGVMDGQFCNEAKMENIVLK